jgi:Ca2+-binding RTX toxin-like protein
MAEKSQAQVAATTIVQEQSFGTEVDSRVNALRQRTESLVSPASSQTARVQSAAVATPTAGDDVLLGTPGDDTISALAGNDTVISLAGNDRVFGGPGNDDIIAGAGNDFVDGGAGADLIFGDSDQNPDFGVVGDDTINGGDGNDTVFGGNGSDQLNGGNGADNLNGGFDNDILRGGAGNDRFFAGEGDDQLFGEAGNDQLNADAGNDSVDGGIGNDVVFGGQGDDSLSGDAGSDQLIGGGGNDSLNGGAGNDRLTGVDPFIPAFGFGNGERDNLTGGGGSDTFVLGTSTEVFYDGRGNNDFALINDFNLSQDFIELPANAPARVAESGDAGQLLPDAQVIASGSARLGSIAGTISESNDVDLYQITLTGGGTFSATTVGGANFDTQLFLFDTNGNLVDQNDDSNGTLQSTLPASPSTSLDAGNYFLAISSFNNDPVGSPLTGFSGGGGSTGDYTISLGGVSSANSGTFSLGASPSGLPSGTAISLDNDLIGIVSGVDPSQLSLNGGNFVFV